MKNSIQKNNIIIENIKYKYILTALSSIGYKYPRSLLRLNKKDITFLYILLLNKFLYLFSHHNISVKNIHMLNKLSLNRLIRGYYISPIIKYKTYSKLANLLLYSRQDCLAYLSALSPSDLAGHMQVVGERLEAEEKEEEEEGADKGEPLQKSHHQPASLGKQGHTVGTSTTPNARRGGGYAFPARTRSSSGQGPGGIGRSGGYPNVHLPHLPLNEK